MVNSTANMLTPWTVYRRLLRYALRHRAMLLLAVLGMAMYASVDTGYAYLVKQFLDGAFIEHNRAMLVFVPIGVVVLFALRSSGDYLAVYGSGYVGRQMIKSIRGDTFEHLMYLPSHYYDRHTSAELLSKLTFNSELVAQAVTESATVLIRDSFTIMGLLAWLFWLNASLTLGALVAAPGIVLLLGAINRAFRRYSSRIQNSMGDVTRVAKEALDGHRLVKVFNAQQFESKAFEQVNEDNRKHNMKLMRARAMANPVVQFVASLALAAVLYFAIQRVLSDNLSVGTFVSFLGALLMITAPLRRLVGVFGPLQQGIAAGRSLFEVIDEEKEADTGTLTLMRARGEVSFNAVSFSYPGKVPAVADVSFNVRAGERVAIVGRSGSGKTTLVGLVPRFYDPQQGAVLIDSVDVREYSLRSLREQVALVSQDVVLLNGSIKDNILFNTHASDAALLQAAQAAHVLEFAQDLPQGLDTPVGDRGVLLSGGQRQRIAIARALLKNTPILILDEATSALDTESERAIQHALETLMRDRTTLIIAHRLSTIESADVIVVMEEGKVVEMGTHQTLLAQAGAYALLHRLQFKASE
jgi:ATP-binding cassette, subfamily B, bacterial MsbA